MAQPPIDRLLRSRAAYPENPVLIAGYDGSDAFYFPAVDSEGRFISRNVIWDVDTMSWVAMQQPVIDTDTLNVTMTGVATESTLVSVNNNLNAINSLVPTAYDYIELAYTSNNLTSVVYKLGGVAGSTVSTLTLDYTGSDLTSVTKT